MVHSQASLCGMRPLSRRAFTLVELLIVIGIIAILIGLVFTAGKTVVGGGKRRATENVLRTLDQAMQTYMEERETDRTSEPIYLATNPTKTPTTGSGSGPEATTVYIIVDGRIGETLNEPVIDSMGLWLANARKYPSVQKLLDKIPDRFVKQWDPDVDGLEPDGPDQLPKLDTIVDAWGKPIRLVLPQFDGIIVNNNDEAAGDKVDFFASGAPLIRSPYSVSDVQSRGLTYKYTEVRRSRYDDSDLGAANSVQIPNTDSDGGRCATHRPYFYSAGEDGEVGYRKDGAEVRDYNADNVYSERPKFNRKPPLP